MDLDKVSSVKIQMSELLEDYVVVRGIAEREDEFELEWLTRMGKFYNIEWDEEKYYDNYVNKEMIDEITAFDKMYYLECEILGLLYKYIVGNDEEIEINI